MDFEVAYSPEQEQFRAEVRAWLAEHVPQVEGDRDSDENYEKYRQLGRELGEKGWLRPTVPVEYGGGALSNDHAIIIAEEIDRYDLRLPPYYDSGGSLGGASILVWGTEEQKRRMLPPIFRGEVVTWQLLTGPEAGSDLAGTQTDAQRDGDEYVLNGEKVFVGGSHTPDFLWTIARTDATGERHKNLSWFLIPADLPGIQYRRMELLGDGNEGIGSGYKNTIYFDNVRVPAAQLVGGENNGWSVASTHLELEHGAGGRIGHNRLFRQARDWATKIKRDGRPLIEYDDVRERLVDVFVLSEVTRLFQLRNFWMNQSQTRMSYEGSQASYYGRMSGLEVSQAMMDIAGPYALTSDPEWDVSGSAAEAYMKSSIVALHPGGTADIQKVIMARRIGVGRDEAERAGRTDGQAGL
jgi:alkylation response protein AidB-like acyl-CoA dehydrogenase